MKKAILFIAIVVIYLIVRFSDINKPLDYNGWSTAHSLITQQIWYKGGIQNYNFSPVYTFNNLKDKNIDNLGGIKDAKGNYYYVSYPPFSFLLPFIIFKLLGIYPSLLPLNIFNAFLHVASAIFVYLLISLVLKKEKQIGVNHEAFFGFILYLFSPGNFWFYTNIYFADILVNTFFIAGVYFILKIIRQENFFSAKYLLFFGIIVLAGVYTEWLGLFFPISVLLYSIIKTKQDKRYLMLFSVTIIFTLISIFLTLYQYTSISGFSNLINEMQHKFLSRGGFSSLFNLKFFMNKFYLQLLKRLSTILILFFVFSSNRQFAQCVPCGADLLCFYDHGGLQQEIHEEGAGTWPRRSLGDALLSCHVSALYLCHAPLSVDQQHRCPLDCDGAGHALHSAPRLSLQDAHGH